MKQSGAVLVIAVGLMLALGAGVGGADPGLPTRDHGAGHWFKRVCTIPADATAACDAQVVTDASGTPTASGSPPVGSYGPTQFHTAYDLPTSSLAASAPTIGIVDAYDDPNAASDLASYDAAYGLPACTTANGCFEKVNQSGGTSYPQENSGWDLEISLDIETAHEICQDCRILLVEASSPSIANLGAAEDEAVKLGANAISNSWGAGEYMGETTDETSYFDHPGVAITASSGDGGFGVEFPAASQYVTAVGGTTLDLNADSTYQSESAWDDGGSGCSSYEPKPSWQKDTGCPRRTVVDVAADADPNTGAAVYDSVPDQGESGWFQVGGTSLASPLIAAVYALAGATSSIDNGSTPYAYLGTTSLHDVTTGSNGNNCSPTYLCTAGPGYDGPTGVGSPNGTTAFSPLPASPDFSLAVSPSSQTVAQGSGGSATYSVSVDDIAGFAGSVTLSASGLPTGASAGFTPNPTSSSSTLTVSTSTALLAGNYPFTISGVSGTLSHTVAATLVVQAPTPTFALSATPTGQSVAPGATASYTVTVSSSNGFTGSVSLGASGLPGKATASFSPSSITTSSSSKLTVSTNRKTGRGTYTVTITGSSGGTKETFPVTLVVT